MAETETPSIMIYLLEKCTPQQQSIWTRWSNASYNCTWN